MPYTTEEFAAEIKRNFPTYNEWTDDHLVNEWVTKFPQYKNWVEQAVPLPRDIEVNFQPAAPKSVAAAPEATAVGPGKVSQWVHKLHPYMEQMKQHGETAAQETGVVPGANAAYRKDWVEGKVPKVPKDKFTPYDYAVAFAEEPEAFGREFLGVFGKPSGAVAEGIRTAYRKITGKKIPADDFNVITSYYHRLGQFAPKGQELIAEELSGKAGQFSGEQLAMMGPYLKLMPAITNGMRSFLLARMAAKAGTGPAVVGLTRAGEMLAGAVGVAGTGAITSSPNTMADVLGAIDRATTGEEVQAALIQGAKRFGVETVVNATVGAVTNAWGRGLSTRIIPGAEWEQAMKSAASKANIGKNVIVQTVRASQADAARNAATGFTASVLNTPTAMLEGTKPIQNAIAQSGLQRQIDLATTAQKPKQAVDAISKFIKKNFTSAGLMPEEMVKANLLREGSVAEQVQKANFHVADVQRAARASYPDGFSTEDMNALNMVMAGELPVSDLPVRMQGPVDAMRKHVDGMSQHLIDSGVVDGPLKAVIEKNKGIYLNRAYQVHDDPKWASKIPPEVWNRSKAWLRSELFFRNLDVQDKIEGLDDQIFSLQGRLVTDVNLIKDPNLVTDVNLIKDPNKVMDVPSRIEKIADRRRKLVQFQDKLATRAEDPQVEAQLRRLLHDQTSPDNYLASGKLGAKNLGILKKRGDLPVELRDLFGEHKDIVANYLRTIEKQANLVANQNFLADLREIGENKFFFTEPTTVDGVSYHVPISSKNNPVWAPLDGMHTSPDIADAMQNYGDVTNLPDWIKPWIKATVWTKYAKTILYPTTHARNFTGNIGFAIANGHLNPAKLGKAFRVAGIELSKKGTPEWREYIQRLKRLRVLDESVRSGELRALSVDVGLGKDAPSLFKSRGVNALKAMKSGTETAYAVEDDFWKVFGFENEKARYAKAYPEWTEDQVEEKAAELIRRTYPTYSNVPRAIRKLRVIPAVGTFVSFPWEVGRVTANTVSLINEELKNPRTRKIGLQRAFGALAAASSVPLIVATTKRHLGITKQKDKDLRRFLPSYSKDSDIAWKKQDKDALSWEYVNVGYQDPHSSLREPVMRLLRGADESEIMDGIVESTWKLMEPFLSEDVFTEKLVDLSRNKKPTGQPIYNEEDDLDKKVAAALEHIYEGVEPGALTSVRRMIKGISADPSTSTGTKQSAKWEAIAMTTGFRVSQIDLLRSLKFKMLDFNRRKQAINFLARERSKEELLQIKRRLYEQKIEDVQAAMRLGAKADDVLRILKATGIPDNDGKIFLIGNKKLTDTYLKAEISMGKVSQKIRGVQRQMTLPEGAR